jgi:hypothetical protein
MVDEKESKVVAVAGNADQVSSIMAVIERVALNPDVDIAKMEKLLDMQERVLNRNSRMAFASDLAEMQSELPSVAENGAIKVGNEVRSKYATFEDINDAIKPVLQKHGFAISFRVKQDAQIEVTAILSHREGHVEETSLKLPSDTSGAKNAVQAIGSAVSYGKRYTMMAMLNITSRAAVDRDDDGQGTSAALPHEQAAEIDLQIAEVKANKKKFLERLGVDDVRKIPAKDYEKAKSLLAEVRKAAAERSKGAVSATA